MGRTALSEPARMPRPRASIKASALNRANTLSPGQQQCQIQQTEPIAAERGNLHSRPAHTAYLFEYELHPSDQRGHNKLHQTGTERGDERPKAVREHRHRHDWGQDPDQQNVRAEGGDGRGSRYRKRRRERLSRWPGRRCEMHLARAAAESRQYARLPLLESHQQQ